MKRRPNSADREYRLQQKSKIAKAWLEAFEKCRQRDENDLFLSADYVIWPDVKIDDSYFEDDYSGLIVAKIRTARRRMFALYLNAVGSAFPDSRHGLAVAIMAAAGLTPLDEAMKNDTQMRELADSYMKTLEALFKDIACVEDFGRFLRLLETVAELVTLAARIGHSDRISDSARQRDKSKSSDASDEKSKQRLRRLGLIREAVYTLLDAQPKATPAHIVLVLLRDFPTVYEPLHEKTAKRDATVLRQEWEKSR